MKKKRILPGKPLEARLEPSAIIRLLEKVVVGEHIPEGMTTPCWMWNAGTDKHGYGQIKWRGKARWAHRVAFEVFNGPPPDGTEIDHKCHCPSCINPEHLEAETVTVNRSRQRRKSRNENGNERKQRRERREPVAAGASAWPDEVAPF